MVYGLWSYDEGNKCSAELEVVVKRIVEVLYIEVKKGTGPPGNEAA